MESLVNENICTFRRGFNVRKIDPWIIRAIYEEVSAAISADTKKGFPLRASDRWEKDLSIDPEDFENAIANVAARAGYDLNNFEQNPFYRKIETLRDAVMFFTHQRRLRPETF